MVMVEPGSREANCFARARATLVEWDAERGLDVISRIRFMLGGCRGREVSPSPSAKLRRLLTCDFVGERDRRARIRAEIRVRFEVGEHRRDPLGAREPAGKDLARDSLERELASLSTQGGDDLVEAQEIADQRQVFAAPCEFR